MIMKKILFVVAMVFCTLTASAQDDSKFILNAGLGASSVVGGDADSKLKFAYKAGVLYDLSITENFSVIPGLEFAVKGFDSNEYDGAINLGYIQIPVFAAYKFPLNSNVNILVKAGPYVAYGVVANDIELTSKITYNAFDKDKGYKRFDAGLIGGVDLVFEDFTVGLEYSHGFAKMMSGAKLYNQAFGVVLGCRL